ncbi:MAG: lipid II flippase MurJ [bacterium]
MKMFRQAAWLASISVVARLPGFLVPVIIASLFGAGPLTDAYFLAYSAALFVGGTIAQAIEVAIIPFVSRERVRTGGSGVTYADLAAKRVTQICVVVWLLGVPLLLWGTARALRPAVLEFALCFTPLAVLWSTAAAYGGALVSAGRIAESTGSMLWRGGGALLGMALVPFGGGLLAVASALSAGELLRVGWLRWRLTRQNRGETSSSPISLGGFGHSAIAQVFAGGTGNSAPIIERLLAVRLGPGAVSHLEYASRLLIVPGVLFDGALGPMMLVRWSNEFANDGVAPSRRRALGVALKAVGLAALCAGVLVLLAEPLVNLLLRHGRFQGSDAKTVADLLQLLALGFVGSMGALIIERHYLALARNRTLAALSIGRVSVRVLTALALLPVSGLHAFGYGYIISEWSYLAALLLLLRPSPASLPASIQDL